ncbi:MAG TPA: TonB-dependent receptor plug domain-containing protein, partial [Cyclobacteriaceae bacterium]|nr:TonB-dependent receptor plug domain-containing protein [Cyclobacteriaceae bacterium]
IGLQTSEVAIGDRAIVDVQLGLDVKQLSEIVVTGTGVPTEKRRLSIAVESVSSDKLPAAPTASVDQALVGKIAGAQISSVSGQPGAQVQILLRGINSIGNRGTAPMILVDGVQMYNTSLNTLDLSAVDRVEVVQGAAAATIYGAQGANGVIQIFTKKGKAGQVNVDFVASTAVNEYLNVGNLHQATLHGFATDASNNVLGSNGPLALNPADLLYNGAIIYNPLDPTNQANKPYNANLKYYDHFAQFLQKAATTNSSIRISGGKDKFDYAVSVSNNHQENNIKNGGNNDRTNLTLNLGGEIVKGLTFRSITQLAYTSNTVNNYIYGVFNTRPFVDFNLKTAQGDYGSNYGSAAGVNGFNPNFVTQYSSNKVNTIDIVSSFNLNYKFPKFVELDARYGLNYQQNDQFYNVANQTQNSNVVDGGFGYYWNGLYVDSGGAGEGDKISTNSTFKNILTKAIFATDFKKDFGLNIPLRTNTMVLFDYRKNLTDTYTSYSTNLPTYTPYTPGAGGNFRVLGGSGNPSFPNTGTVPFVTYGYLVNQTIEYGELAGVTGGVRSDYSSAFGKGSTPFTFPRGSAFFRISGLSFWDNSGISKVLLEWKLRAAYGQAGIQPQPFDRYVTLNPATIGSDPAFSYQTSAHNPNLNVEVSTETEFGTDFTVNALDNTPWLNNISISATYWKRSTDNSIFSVDVAPSTGSGSLYTNAFG